MAGVNYLDGMFLGKQELDRHDQIQDLYNTMLLTRMGNLESTALKFEGLIDPRISGLTIQAYRWGSTSGIWVGVSTTSRPKTKASELLGRQIIGFDSQGRAMGALTSDSPLIVAGENWLGYQSMYSGANYVLVEYASETSWEPVRISVSDKTITIDEGWKLVKSLFRNANAGSGKNVVIETEGEDRLTITSMVDYGTMGVLTVAEDVTVYSQRFKVLHTVSPYSYVSAEEVYSYPNFKISLVDDITNYDIPAGKYLLGGFVNDGGTISDIEVYNSETKIWRSYGSWVRFDFIGLSLIKNSINSEYLNSMLWPFSFMQDANLNYGSSSQDHPFVLSDLLNPTEFWSGGQIFSEFVGESVWFVSRLYVGAGTMYLDTTPMLINGYKPPLEFETYVDHLNGGKLVTPDGEINFTSSGRTLIKFKYFFGQTSHYFAIPFKVGV